MTDTRLAPYGALALRVALGTMFIAHAGQDIYGFAAYHASRPNLLGPMGVEETARMNGIGRVLGWQALNAMAAEGYVYSVASGDGPAEFFAHVFGATQIEASSLSLSDELRGGEAA